MHSYVNASPTALSQVRDATSADATMALLRETIANGWPETRSECPETLPPYWTFRDELGVEDGVVLLKGTRIVIPPTLRNSFLEKNPLRTPRNGEVQTESEIICLLA